MLIGRHSFYEDGCQILRWADDVWVDVGHFCSIAREVLFILGGEHDHHNVTSFPLRRRLGLATTKRDMVDIRGKHILVGNDVWIGARATLLNGVVVGDGAVIGAGTVVTSSVPPYAVVVGNPPRIVHYRFSPEQIEALLEIRWWDWPDDKIASFSRLLTSHNIDKFIRKARST
jgi:acetyltransferase-like isoleucine patch superfamily enzyme